MGREGIANYLSKSNCKKQIFENKIDAKQFTESYLWLNYIERE